MPKFQLQVVQRFRYERTSVVTVEADNLEDAIESAEQDEEVRDHQLGDWAEHFDLIEEVVSPV